MKKAIAILAGMLCWGGSMVCGQQAPTDPQPNLSVETQRKIEQSVVYQTEVLNRIFGVEVKVDGALPRTLRAKQPWQMINPFAPREYGDGYDNLSVDPMPEPGKTYGISLIGIRF